MAYRRFLSRDGSFNVTRVGMKRLRRRDLYHTLLSVHWPKFFSAVLGYYFTVNLAFGLAYLACGPEALHGTVDTGVGGRFLDCFFFSVQTFATIGYGRIAPVGLLANCIVTAEALVGLMSLALMTGMLFARFSRPTARVSFSNRAVIQSHDGVPSLLFRVVNMRTNQIVDAEITVVLTRAEKTSEGERYRNYYELKLERARSPIFALSWTVVHPIEASSPLAGMTHERLLQDECEIIVSLTGIDETFSQAIHSRFSYLPDEIAWNRGFRDIMTRSPDGQIVLDAAKLHDLV